jgi:type III restriction enzyme
MPDEVAVEPTAISALEPLFAPHEEPAAHRVRGEDGGPAKIVPHRRPTPIPIAQNLRGAVRRWRATDYPGASETTRELLHHWFGRDHVLDLGGKERVPFRYYFCQREAIETLIYLYEVRRLTALSAVTAEFTAAPDEEGQPGEAARRASLGIHPDEDQWARYAFKLATGAGKTKVMSLAMVWSYFHALRESGSTMARHFVVIAPNLTVFERLKDDFKPARGGGDIFDRDPLIPVAWRGDWDLSVVLQDEAGGAATGGTLYLTNIHRLYEPATRRKSEAEMFEWMGPEVSKAKALDTGAALRARIAGHRRVMVLNDEAHHLWDPGSAWNEAIAGIHASLGGASRTGRDGGISAQLDFSATPKDNAGRVFKHVICDTPLGEAVDAGIVKTPVLGKGKRWADRPSKDASEQYQEQLMVGYERWKMSQAEWSPSGKKPLLFVMTEDTDAANQIALRLNSDPLYEELNRRTVNLHTKLKGKIKWIGGKKAGHPEFVENESEISDEDLQALRQLSRDLDSDANPYRCIVSVLMLREGWDVRNVTTIVPLRAYNSPANILPEQTLGRGLRRMTPPAAETTVQEIVTVVEHPAFASLYKEQLSQEGLEITEVDAEESTRTTVTIYADTEKKDVSALEIELPSLTGGFIRTAKLEGLTVEDVRKAFARYRPLALGEVRTETLQYEERHLFTDEVVKRMEIKLPLLENPIGAIAFFREELEATTALKGTHAVLAPLLETFLTEMLFGEKIELFDPRLLSRLAQHHDVREHIRATFVPLIVARTTSEVKRRTTGERVRLSEWKPFQATHSSVHPAIPAARTLFNLVPCNRKLEVAMAQTLDRTFKDVAAFAKNAGPQALRIDYLTDQRRLSLYTPDFIARKTDGAHLLIETKGRVDKDVPLKASAAAGWCQAATATGARWEYLYVPEGVFLEFSGDRIADLESICAPHLADLIAERVEPQLTLPLGESAEEAASLDAFASPEDQAELPEKVRKRVEQAVTVFRFLEKKAEASFADAFTSLLGPIDDAAKALLCGLLAATVPATEPEITSFFTGDLSSLPQDERKSVEWNGLNLRKLLVDGAGAMPIGVLRWSLKYAKSPRPALGGIFTTIKEQMAEIATKDFTGRIVAVNEFRNRYIAHQERELSDAEMARQGLKDWIAALAEMRRKTPRDA